MTNIEWETLTLNEIGLGISKGNFDPCDIVNYFLNKIEKDPDRDKIFLNILSDKARKEAKAARGRAEKNERLSPYDGIPLAWKDNIDIQGLPTSAGLPILARKNAQKDADAYRIASKAGLICLGKTNMTELAFSGLGINPSYGTPRNPFGLNEPHVPGGSSAGSAVAVAKGLCCAAIGTDTGGSVRTPAAWNGLVGLKTTAGLISTKGIVPLSQTLDTVGFLTKTVEDSASLYKVFTKTNNINLANLNCNESNLLVCSNLVWDEINPEVNSVMRKSIEKISKAGANVEWGNIEEFGTVLDLLKNHGHIVNYEGNKNWGEFLDANPGSISADILDRFHIGAKIKEESINYVYKSLQEAKEQYKIKINKYNAVIMPTVSSLPPIISELESNKELYARENLLSLRNTRLVNLLGLCAISIPAGITASGFPVGMMLIAFPFSEVKLLKLASAIEKECVYY